MPTPTTPNNPPLKTPEQIREDILFLEFTKAIRALEQWQSAIQAEARKAAIEECLEVDAIKSWLDSASHKPWCEQSPGNIYSSDGECDCGLEKAKQQLQSLL